jgi:ferric-dicitrate binding protein FerR (iron transport regulator)
VLGTKFNVKAYSSETKTITTLTSGKVEVTTNKNDYRVLNPNEQLVFDHSNSIIDVTEIPSNETDSWRTGQLVFNDASFDEIMQTLERHFNTSIITGTNFTIDPNKRYTVKFLKDEDIDMILMILEDVIGFSYQRNGSQIELTNSK